MQRIWHVPRVSRQTYLRFHVKQVFDTHSFPVFISLINEFVFGPGHVDVFVGWRFGFFCGMRRCITIMD